MKALKPIRTFILTLLLIFAVSFLTDIPVIKENWIRYTLVIILSSGILIIGLLTAWEQLKELKQ